MNYNQLIEGDHYAWCSSRPRGKFPMNGIEVVVTSTRKKRVWGNDNASTFVDLKIVESGQIISNARARDIIDWWDSYKDERDYHVREKNERDRVGNEIRARQKATREAVKNKMREKYKIETEVSGYTQTFNIAIPRKELLNWLGVTDEDIDNLASNALGYDITTGTSLDGGNSLRLVSNGDA